MGYFPFFMEIKNKLFIIVGGGTVALRKIEKLIPFEPLIKVIAPDICKGIQSISNIEIIQRNFQDSDLENAFAVIGASDHEALNAHIAELCQERNIPVNIVDDPEKCSFLFPALVKEQNITIGISTSGGSPVFAKFLRMQIEDLLDDHYLDIAGILSRFRPIIRQMFDSPEKRQSANDAVLDLCLLDELPSDEEITDMLERIKIAYENQNWNTEK